MTKETEAEAIDVSWVHEMYENPSEADMAAGRQDLINWAVWVTETRNEVAPERPRPRAAGAQPSAVRL